MSRTPYQQSPWFFEIEFVAKRHGYGELNEEIIFLIDYNTKTAYSSSERLSPIMRIEEERLHTNASYSK